MDYQKLSDDRLGEPCEAIRSRVERARELQPKRFSDGEAKEETGKEAGALNVVCNADMRVAEIRQFCKLDGAGKSLVRATMGQMNLSARRYHWELKLARTIADLAGCEQILAAHLAEALQYRPKMMLT
ncbi:MAG TPA: hypothetical protein VMJ64_07290 [Anaerolineales bacterium]|nr:hypothetical protein [Anaerolineales bacterium]